MFLQSGVLLLAICLAAGHPDRPQQNGSSPSAIVEQSDGDNRCSTVCTNAHGGKFNPATNTCECPLNEHIDGTDLHLVTKNAEKANVSLPTDKADDKESTKHSKREISMETRRNAGGHTGRAGATSRSLSRAVTPRSNSKGDTFKPPLTLKKSLRPRRQDKAATFMKLRSKLGIENPRLAELQEKLDNLKAKLASPKVGSRANFLVEEHEKHKKLLEELKQKHEERLRKNRAKIESKTVGSIKKIKKPVLGLKIKPKKKIHILKSRNNIDAKTDKEQSDKSKTKNSNEVTVATTNQETKPTKSKEDTETVAKPQGTSQNTSPSTEPPVKQTPSVTQKREVITPAAQIQEKPAQPKKQFFKSLDNRNKIKTQVKEKLSENRKTPRVASTPLSNTELQNNFNKNKESISSAVKQMKEKHGEIVERLRSSIPEKSRKITSVSNKSTDKDSGA